VKEIRNVNKIFVGKFDDKEGLLGRTELLTRNFFLFFVIRPYWKCHDRGRDGRTCFIREHAIRIKLHEHDDDEMGWN
jgi:hypothetical protein